MTCKYSSIMNVMEIVARSKDSWSDAAQKGVSQAHKTIKCIRTIKVEDMTAQISEGFITEYVVRIKILYDVQEAS